MHFRLGRARFLLPLAGALACGGRSVVHDEGDGAPNGGADSGYGGSGTGAGANTGASGGVVSQGGTTAGASSGGGGAMPAGGTSGKAAGGTSGKATGGTTSTGGSSGTNTCTPCVTQACTTVTPPTNTINDFENLLIIDGDPTSGIYGVNDATGMPKPEWWLGYFSGSFAYPNVPAECTGDPAPMYPLTRVDTGGELHVTGTVGTYAGFGIWLGQCMVDMSAHSGISFRIGGSAGPDRITFRVHTKTNTAPDPCLVGKGTCLGSSTGGCAPAGVDFFVSETPEVKSLRFETLIGGLPTHAVDPAEVVQLSWAFSWGDGYVPYEVDVTVDDVVLFD